MKNNALKPKDEPPAKSMALGNDDDEDPWETHPARPSQSQARGKGSLPLGHHRQGKRQGRRTPLGPHRARQAARETQDRKSVV